jgi:hypothetical protein
VHLLVTKNFDIYRNARYYNNKYIYIYICCFFKYITIVLYYHRWIQENSSSAVYHQNVSETFNMEILSNFSAVKNILNKCPYKFHTHDISRTVSRETLRRTFI